MLDLNTLYDDIAAMPNPFGVWAHHEAAEALRYVLGRVLEAHGRPLALDVQVVDDTQRGAVIVSTPWETELELVLGPTLPAALRARDGAGPEATARLLAELIAGEAARNYVAQLEPSGA